MKLVQIKNVITKYLTIGTWAHMASGFAKSKEYGSTVYLEFKEQALKLIDDYEKRGELNCEIADIVKKL